MSELTITALRIGFVILLWLFIFSVLAVLRTDLFGTAVVRRTGNSQPASRKLRRRNHDDPEPVRAVPARPVSTSVVVVEGALRGTSLPLGNMPIMIGRAPECTLVLEDDYASSKHARLFKRDEDWCVEDLGSTNGTLLNDSPLRGSSVMRPGDSVRIGTTVLELRRGTR